MKNIKKLTVTMLSMLFIMQLAAPIASAVKLSGSVVIKAGDKGYTEVSNVPFSDSSVLGVNGTTTKYTSGSVQVGSYAQFTPAIEAGKYDVYVYKLARNDTDSATKTEVHYADGVFETKIDFTEGTSGWVPLGTFEFSGNAAECVRIIKSSAAMIRVDSVKFEKSGGARVIDLRSKGQDTKSPWGEVSKTTDEIAYSFYVSPQGNDASNGSIEKPFATIERAQKEVRKLLPHAEGNIYVYLRGGIYQMKKPAVFTAEDSAPDGIKVVWCAYENEEPVLTGALKADNWVLSQGNIWKTKIEENIDFRQIYIGNEKGVRARTPNKGEYLTLDREKTNTGFDIQKGIIAPSDFKDDMELAIRNVWMHKRLKIDSVKDTDTHTSIAIEPYMWNDIMTGAQGATIYYGVKYWLENAYTFMDQNGEWYYDKKKKELYLMSDTDPNQLTITIPQLETLIDLQGTLDTPVSNIEFSGITFKYTNWTRPNEYGLNDIQANTLFPSPNHYKEDKQYRYGFAKEYIPAAFSSQTAFHVSVNDCKFENLGGTGISFKNGGAHINIDKNVFNGCANTAIEVGEDSYKPNDARMRISDVVIDNNLIYDVANEYYGGLGILLFYANGAKITHNEIKNVPYSAINAGWGWANNEYVETSRDFTISHNKIENFCMELNDGGAIYMPNPTFGEAIMEKNYIVGSEQTMRTGTMLHGIYHDAFGANWIDRYNVIDCIIDWITGRGVKDRDYFGSITAYDNYTTSKSEDNIGGIFEEIKEKTHYVESAEKWPDEALQIIQESGLESQNEYLREKLGIRAWASPAAYECYAGNEGKFHFDGLSADIDVTLLLPNGVFVDKTTKKGNTTDIPYYVSNALQPDVYTVTAVFSENGKEIGREDIKLAVNEKLEAGIYLTIGTDHYQEEGDWAASSISGYFGGSRYGYSKGAKATFKTQVEPGMYKVSVYRVFHATSDKNAKVTVKDKNGGHESYYDTTVSPAGWVSVGTYEFDGDAEITIERTSEDESSYVRVSEVKLEKADSVIATEQIMPVLRELSGTVILHIGANDALVEGFKKKIDESKSVVPFIDNDRTLIPVRFIAEALGLHVTYEEDTRRVVINGSGNEVIFQIGETQWLKNGVPMESDVAAQISGDRTFIPLRALMEALDKKVEFYDGVVYVGEKQGLIAKTYHYFKNVLSGAEVE